MHLLAVQLRVPDRPLRTQEPPPFTTVGLRSERITLTDRAKPSHDGTVNILRARIDQCSYTGARFEYELSLGDLRIHTESPIQHTGREINLLIRPDDCLLYPETV
ncbi:TOBE domain-containing protein [Streptomyces sp. NPDC044984]|uniref:TOBE domain-containing protein n=1 Tax=Streptomyces sp. NPDC044984 TaxID=3154335 RepID=UPI0033CFE460